MQPDPFLHFAEQQRSYELIEQYRALLVQDALEILRMDPDADVVGFILDGDTPDVASIRLALQKSTGRDHPPGIVLGAVQRAVVVAILRANAPATLEHLPPMRTVAGLQLPMVAATRNGYRCAATRLPMAGE